MRPRARRLRRRPTLLNRPSYYSWRQGAPTNIQYRFTWSKLSRIKCTSKTRSCTLQSLLTKSRRGKLPCPVIKRSLVIAMARPMTLRDRTQQSTKMAKSSPPLPNTLRTMALKALVVLIGVTRRTSWAEVVSMEAMALLRLVKIRPTSTR